LAPAGLVVADHTADKTPLLELLRSASLETFAHPYFL
jgi:hypothetical protein